ncbi:MAG: hypothetical protein KA072_07555 [Thermoanaerobaculaceae bacterium]|nr:hypothetical protein [Thermoanaerobaculaceae bacterium]MDI9622162.1 hypothetical protein [Acidobacteriota bacterium]NLH10061.1 hypothetical protein [Holophagae bacterium]
MAPPQHDPDAPSPEDLAGTLVYARQLVARNELRRAARLLEELVNRIPDPEALLMLAKIEIERPTTQGQALEHLRLATVGNPQLTEAWLLLANYWGLRGQPDKQKRCLEKILSYDPRNRDARDAVELLATRR